MALTTTNATGSQSTTQNPQTSGAAATGTESSSVQPGTAASALTSNDGVALRPKQLSTIPIRTQSTGTTQVPIAQRDTNPVLTSVSIGLFIIAVVLFVLMARADKSTTES